jgi:DNA-binding MarR family transcriptional regulator
MQPADISPAPSIDGTRPGLSEATLLYLIKQLELVVRSRLETVTRDVGLTVPQYTAMTVLERRPGLTSAQLAKNSFVRAQTMGQVTNELESRGLIVRHEDPGNQRRQPLSVTEKGQQLLDELAPAVEQIEAQMVAALPRAEIRRFREALRSCRYALGDHWAH